jgi:putative glutamine amidotransferase
VAEHLGERAVVDSYHHQAVLALGEGIRAVAWAPHGVVEAIEMPAAAAFVLGVQWELHEEWRADGAMFGIWRAFVRAAAQRSEDRDVIEASR